MDRPERHPASARRRTSAVLTCAAITIVALAVACVRGPSADLAITDVTIIDPARGSATPGQTVLVAGDRITSIGPAEKLPLPAGAERIDGRDRFLIPGLWDMHVHALWDSTVVRAFLPLFVANGVTGVRDMGGPLHQVLAGRAAVRSGRVTGPRIVAAGPILDGPDPIHPAESWAISSPEEARQAVDSLSRAGVDFIKVYTMLSAEAFTAIAAQARLLDIPFAGHVPASVTPLEAARLGMRSMEHLRTELGGLCDLKDPDECAVLFAALREADVRQVPTLSVRHFALNGCEDGALAARLRYMPPVVRGFWGLEREQAANRSAAERDRLAEHLRQQELLTAALYQAQVPILAGTDAGDRCLFPGFTLHDELELLVDAGLSDVDALAAATVNPARYLAATDTLGSIGEGMRADLVLLEANPLTDVRNTRRIVAVVLRGVPYDRSDLDQMLEKAAAEAGQE